MLKRRLLFVCSLALVVAACNKSTETRPTPIGEHSSADTAAQSTPAIAGSQTILAPPPGASPVAKPVEVQPLPVPTSGDSSAMLGALTQALRKYSAEHQRVPGSFSEVIAAGYVKNMPAPPAGKKFSINAKRVEVVLANQ